MYLYFLILPFIKNKIASISSKKENIMDLLWDRKMKMSNQVKDFPVKFSAGSSLLNKANELPGTKREINLLSSRLNKLFPTNFTKK